MSSLSSRIKLAREKMSYIQRELADVLEISLPALREYEQAKSIPGSNVITSMTELGWNANWLLTGEGEMFRPLVLTQAQIKIVELFRDFRGGDITCPSLALARKNFVDTYHQLHEYFTENIAWIYEHHSGLSLKELIQWDMSLTDDVYHNTSIDLNFLRVVTKEIEQSLKSHDIDLPVWLIGQIQEMTISKVLQLEGIEPLLSMLDKMIKREVR